MTSRSPTRPGRSVAVLADTGSRWKWAVTLARRLSPARGVLGYLFATVAPALRELAAL